MIKELPKPPVNPCFMCTKPGMDEEWELDFLKLIYEGSQDAKNEGPKLCEKHQGFCREKIEKFDVRQPGEEG